MRSRLTSLVAATAGLAGFHAAPAQAAFIFTGTGDATASTYFQQQAYSGFHFDGGGPSSFAITEGISVNSNFGYSPTLVRDGSTQSNQGATRCTSTRTPSRRAHGFAQLRELLRRQRAGRRRLLHRRRFGFAHLDPLQLALRPRGPRGVQLERHRHRELADRRRQPAASTSSRARAQAARRSTCSPTASSIWPWPLLVLDPGRRLHPGVRPAVLVVGLCPGQPRRRAAGDRASRRSRTTRAPTSSSASISTTPRTS